MQCGRKPFLLISAALILALTSCSRSAALSRQDNGAQSPEAVSHEAAAQPESHEGPPPEESTEPAVPAETPYDAALAKARQRGLAVDNGTHGPLDDINILQEWVLSYRNGDPATASVLLSGQGFPDTLFALECDGGPAYTVTEYRQSDGMEADPVTYQSSQVIERAYDYVFLPDVPRDVRAHAVVIHHTPLGDVEELPWDPATDASFHGISPEEAEARAKELDHRIYQHISVIPNIYGGGVFLKDSVLAEADGLELSEFVFRTVGAVRVDRRLCYLVYGNRDPEALARGEHGGSVTAVSVDGGLAFIQSMVDGSWIFAEDANQAAYPGAWPQVETDFYKKAYAMGYTDQQLAVLSGLVRASANTALNLTNSDGYEFRHSFAPDSRYELDGYLVDAGGEGMTGCMYLRDNQTGRVTILPDWQNGYSSFRFLDNDTFYAAICRVGGADYEAGIRFYHAAAPELPYTRWNLTASEEGTGMERMLLGAYSIEEGDLAAAFWCEIPMSWGGWVNEDTQTYRISLIDRTGKNMADFDTGVKLEQGNVGIVSPDCDEPNDTLPVVPGSLYFAVREQSYSLNLSSGEVTILERQAT